MRVQAEERPPAPARCQGELGNPYNPIRRRPSPAPRNGAGMPSHRSWPWRPSISTRRCFSRAAGLFVISLPSSHHIGPRGPRPGPCHGHRREPITTGCPTLSADCERPGRVFGAAMLAPHDVSAAVDELARNVERGFKAAFLAPVLWTTGHGTTRSTTRLWREASGSACRSVSTGAVSPEAGLLLQRAPRQDDAVAPIQPTPRHHVRGDLLHVGRHPRALPRAPGRAARGQLLLGALHDVPPRRALGMDRQVRGTGAPTKPSEYLLDNCFVSCEADEEPAKYYFDDFGDDNVVFSTDYPHADSKFPHATEVVPGAAIRGVDQAKGPLGQLRQALRSRGASRLRAAGPHLSWRR